LCLQQISFSLNWLFELVSKALGKFTAPRVTN